jgi:hypothetical protein
MFSITRTSRSQNVEVLYYSTVHCGGRAALSLSPSKESMARHVPAAPGAPVAALVLLVTLTSLGMIEAVVPRAAWAAAEDNPAIGKVILLNREAIEEYKRLNFDQAQRLLDQALDVAANAGLTQHPVRARTYVTLGVVTAGGLKRRDVAVRLFRKALQIQPEIQLSSELATPEIQAAFDEAVKGLGSEPRVERLASELLVHDPISAAARGEAVTIAVTPDESLQVDRLVLAYRPSGAPTFAKVNMQKQADGVFEGVIPPPATGGAQVAYYIEARNIDGKLVSSRGSPVAPMVVALAEGPSGGAVATQPGAPSAPVAHGAPFVVGLLVGSGAGFTSGTADVTGYELGGGTFAWAKFVHVAPELGYFVTPRLMLAVQGRLQFMQGSGLLEYKPPGSLPAAECGSDGVCSPAKMAFAGFAKASWFFSGAEAAFRPYASLSLGGGYVRHVVKLDHSDCGAMQDQACVDTVGAGPFLVGPGVGFHYRLANVTHLVVALETLLGAPSFTVHADLNVGLGFVF